MFRPPAAPRAGWDHLVRQVMVAIGLVMAAARVHGAAPPGDPRAASTIRMAERLSSVADQVVALNTQFISRGQVDELRQLQGRQPGLTNDPAFRYRLATALLNSGRNTEALAELAATGALELARSGSVNPLNRRNLMYDTALAHLREAERLNCLSNHNADSCLIPLRDGGIHRDRAPGRRAVAVLTNMLAEFPEDLSARWLLNIACMTVGDYPGRVPARWLIPESAFASEAPFPRFRDVAPQAGLAAEELSGGVAVEDFDGDGLLDVMVTSIGLRDPMHFYRNEGNGTFRDRTREAGLQGETGGLNLITADYDNDGHVDVFVLRGAWLREEGRHPNSLLRNRGDGTFEDVTEAAGLLSFHPTQSGVWWDFDGDGWIDLFIGNETAPNEPRHSCELYRNQGNGTFRNVAGISGVTLGSYVKGVVAGDYNNDGRPDLYVSVLGGRNRLFRNDGPKVPGGGGNDGWLFTDVGPAAGVVEPVESFPCWFFDYNNDGLPDLFVGGYQVKEVSEVAADYLGLPNRGARPRLYRNRGDGTFADVTAGARLDRVLLAMGANFGDLDNDGWLDFYLGTGNLDLATIVPNRMFRNAEGLFFQDVTTAGGFGNLQKGHAVAFADLDNDGDQDVFEDLGGAVSGDVYPNALFENPGFGNSWLMLRLEGVKANRSAIGARVRVDFESGGEVRSLHRTVGTGGSFGASPLRLELGLSRARRIVGVSVTWPGSGTQQVFSELNPNTAYHLREGDPAPRPVKLPTFQFPRAGSGAHDHAHH